MFYYVLCFITYYLVDPNFFLFFSFKKQIPSIVSAHRNLEHALPSLEAAMQAVGNIDKGELMELRSMKKPSALAEQVLESVCILLGVKSDWNSALKVLADSQFIQRLLDFDKDNVPEQICKRIRRYIDNPSFIPDEVGKTSRICSALCMWVRAIGKKEEAPKM